MKGFGTVLLSCTFLAALAAANVATGVNEREWTPGSGLRHGGVRTSDTEIHDSLNKDVRAIFLSNFDQSISYWSCVGF